MKNTEAQNKIIEGIIQSDIPSKLAQGIVAYLKAEFAKLPIIEDPANKVNEDIKPE